MDFVSLENALQILYGLSCSPVLTRWTVRPTNELRRRVIGALTPRSAGRAAGAPSAVEVVVLDPAELSATGEQGEAGMVDPAEERAERVAA